MSIYSFAIREHQEAIRLAPDLQEAYFNLGIAYAKSGDAPKALETFEKAITLKPDDADSYNNLAFACFKTGRYKEAVEAARKAIDLRPDYPEAYYNLGVSYFRMDMTADAMEALKQSIRLNPNIPEAHFGLGVIYSIQDLPAALKEYEILKNLDPSGAKALEDIIKECRALRHAGAGCCDRKRRGELSKLHVATYHLVPSPSDAERRYPQPRARQERQPVHAILRDAA